jgi:NAD(P)-dependent dehydrogenase (short-subunit alcohol dehydrogenase family)
MSAAMALLEGKVALITGGARGIGLAIASALGAEGARLVLVDNGCARDGTQEDPGLVEAQAAELRAKGFDVRAFACNVTDAAACENLFAELEEGEGLPNILVNNAGIIRDRSLFQLTPEDFDAVLQTHVRGAFLYTAAFAKALRKHKRGGSILNMTSLSGLLGNIGQINESAAKAAVYGLTRSSSIELQKFGITVNAIAAIAKTRLTEDLPMFEKVQGTMEPEHVAPLAVFLLSPLAEGPSGLAFSVAGGRIARIGLLEGRGRTKQAEQGPWTPQEIADNFEAISKV